MGFRQQTKSNSMTGAQRGLVHSLYRDAGLDKDPDTRRAMQESITGERSMAKWTNTHVQKMIRHLRGLQGELPPIEAYDDPPVPKAMKPIPLPTDPPSADKLELMTNLFNDVGAKGIVKTHFIQRQLKGNHWPQTNKEANKVIEALKSMRARGFKFGGEKTNSEASTKKTTVNE